LVMAAGPNNLGRGAPGSAGPDGWCYLLLKMLRGSEGTLLPGAWVPLLKAVVSA
jgi:hypothetical protein